MKSEDQPRLSDDNAGHIILGIVLYQFHLSAHVMRQFLASSLLVLAMVSFVKRQCLLVFLDCRKFNPQYDFCIYTVFYLTSLSLTNAQQSLKVFVAVLSVILAFYWYF